MELSIKSAQCGSSPFDSIRGYRADGTEYWTGRELMRWLGYAKWENAEKAILRALKSCANQGHDITKHFPEVGKLSNQHNNKVVEIKDYELSRFACYLVAQNADPEKEMVAMAQGYFAAKTREAEVVIPAQQEKLEILKLENENLRLQVEANNSALALGNFRHMVSVTCPEPIQQKILGYQTIEKIEYRDRVLHNDDFLRDGSTINKTDLCHRYGILTKGGKPDYKRVNFLLQNMPSEAFRLTAAIRENEELDRAYLPDLDRLWQEASRQMWFGE